MFVCWLDPGLLTGITMYNFDYNEFSYCDEHDLAWTGKVLERYREKRDDLHVGWETYTIMKGPQTQAPWSLEVIGMTKYICAKQGYTLLNPQAPKTREVVTDKMLRDLGLYDMIKGKKDAKSSLQHCIAWMIINKKLPTDWEKNVYGKLL
jgi:hypothetical protein